MNLARNTAHALRRILQDWRVLAVVAFGSLAISLTLGFTALARVQAQADQVQEQADRTAREVVNRQVASCESSNSNRMTLRTVLDQAAHPPPGGPIDYRHIAGWDRLDPQTQTYVANLLDDLRAGTTNGYLVHVLDLYKQTNPIIDCARLRKSLEQKLHR